MPNQTDLIADPFRAARLILLLRQEGVTDNNVLKTMETIDRGAFVEDALTQLAFEDCVLPIPCGQIIPSPVVTGQLLAALELEGQREARILLVGVGGAYTAALAAQLGADVFAVERYRRLADAARQRVVALGIENIAIRHGDGLLGWPERGPFDRILLTGAVSAVPDTLIRQLSAGGKVIAPMEDDDGPYIATLGAEGPPMRRQLHASLPPLSEGVAHAL